MEDNSGDNRNRQIGKYWDSMTSNSKPKRVRWWESPLILRHINEMVCGIDLDGFSAGTAYLADKESKGCKFK
jgi:hypothetical protein